MESGCESYGAYAMVIEICIWPAMITLILCCQSNVLLYKTFI